MSVLLVRAENNKTQDVIKRLLEFPSSTSHPPSPFAHKTHRRGYLRVFFLLQRRPPSLPPLAGFKAAAPRPSSLYPTHRYPMLRSSLLLLAATLAAPAAASASSCIHRVGDYQVDLSSLQTSADTPLRYVSPDGGRIYLATVCGSARVLGSACKGVEDAVAGVEQSCEQYGRASQQQGHYTFIDSAHPEKGVSVSYGGGSRCASPLSPYWTVSFHFICDVEARLPSKALWGVDQEPTSCHFSYYFRTPAACPVYVGGGGADGGGEIGGGRSGLSSFAFLLTLLVVMGLMAYVGLGVYKARSLGAEGWDCVPHIEGLRSGVRAVRLHVYLPLIRFWGVVTEGEGGGGGGGGGDGGDLTVEGKKKKGSLLDEEVRMERGDGSAAGGGGGGRGGGLF